MGSGNDPQPDAIRFSSESTERSAVRDPNTSISLVETREGDSVSDVLKKIQARSRQLGTTIIPILR
jgi:hypothetical protein